MGICDVLCLIWFFDVNLVFVKSQVQCLIYCMYCIKDICCMMMLIVILITNVKLQISALRSCAKLLSSATSSDSSDQFKSRAVADVESSVPLSRLDKSMYYGGSRAVFGKSLLRFVCELSFHAVHILFLPL